MSSPLQVRKAHPSEIPIITQLQINAFRGRALNDALFPEHLRVSPGDQDELAHRIRGLERVFANPNRHHLVCVDENDIIMGYAEWSSGEDPIWEVTEEERAARLARAPKSLDLEAAERIGREAAVLERTLKTALGDEGFRNAWSLNAIAVDPAHQRKGVGRLLMAWGEKRAQEENKNIHLTSSSAGAKMYRALGYEEVGSSEIMGALEYAFVKRVT